MGIRFACPNGHPLHVKVELAGKRGVCPECQVRFTIPTPPGLAKSAASSSAGTKKAAQQPAATPQQSTEQASAQTSPTATQQPVAATVAAVRKTPTQSAAPITVPPASPSPPPTASQPAPPADEPVAWYVRPAAGGQFGPADDAQMQQWVAEGRVGADAHVWRTGWVDWRRATEATEHFSLPNAPSTGGSPLSNPSEYNVGGVAAGDASAAASDPSIVTAKYKRKKLQSARGQQLAAILLICLTIILAGVLIWVIRGTTETDSPPAAEPATTLPEAGDGEPTGEAEQDNETMDNPEAAADDTDTTPDQMNDDA